MKLRRALLSSAILSISIAAPVAAADCEPRQGQAIVLDWKTVVGKKLLMLGVRPIKTECIEDSKSTYQLKGLPGIFKSEEDAINVFKYLQALERLGLTPENIADGLRYVQKIETEIEGAPNKGARAHCDGRAPTEARRHRERTQIANPDLATQRTCLAMCEAGPQLFIYCRWAPSAPSFDSPSLEVYTPFI